MNRSRKTYSELRGLRTFEERYDYLRLKASVGDSTFGFDRYLNQQLYRSRRWRRVRDEVIVRDNGCDLAIPDREISGLIVIHHMNAITPEDIEDENPVIFDLENLVCVSPATHLAIHYGDESLLIKPPIVRYPGDTTPWRKNA